MPHITLAQRGLGRTAILVNLDYAHYMHTHLTHTLPT